MTEAMDMEATKKGLQYLADILAYGDAKLFEDGMYVAPYFRHVEKFSKEHCRMVFTKIASEANVMPTPIELATFFGVSANPDVTLTTSIKSELLRAAAGEDNMLSKKAKAFLKFEGLTIWDISRNESSRMKISRKNIEGFIEASKIDPNLESSLLHNPDADLVKRIPPSPDKDKKHVPRSDAECKQIKKTLLERFHAMTQEPEMKAKVAANLKRCKEKAKRQAAEDAVRGLC